MLSALIARARSTTNKEKARHLLVRADTLVNRGYPVLEEEAHVVESAVPASFSRRGQIVTYGPSEDMRKNREFHAKERILTCYGR